MFSSVDFYHVSSEVQWGVENDEILSLALFLCARMVNAVEVPFQTLVIDEILISNFIPLTEKALLMLLSHVRVQFIATKKTLSTKFA